MSKREIMQLTLNDVQKAFEKVEELINEPNSRLSLSILYQYENN